MLKILICSTLSCFILLGANAQFVNDYTKAADKYFAAGDYFSAATYYEKAINPGKSKTGSQSFHPYDASAAGNKTTLTAETNVNAVSAIYNLAESYRMIHYHIKALPYYKQVIDLNTASFPLAKYHYANTLKALEKYDESEIAYRSFLQTYSASDMYKKNAERELKNLAYIQLELKKTNISAYTLKKADINTTNGGTYAPMWAKDQSLWFTSTREVAGKNDNRIYMANYSGESAGVPTAVNVPVDGDIQQGVTAINPLGNRLFITRWEIEKKKSNAAIYSSSLENGTWSSPVQTNLNISGSNTQQPFVMPDGKHIIFSSDRPGGQGGYDLYIATLDENGNTGSPVNMGNNINTEYDEQSPFYHAASNTFVFSSNGRTGMGGYDLFYSTGTLNNFSAPQNFGYPVNSVKDDLYFTSRGPARNILENVMMSSDRDAACCLELFSLNRTKPMKQITGKVVDCSTGAMLSNVRVVVYDSINNKIILDKTTDAFGTYTYELDEYLSLKTTGSITGYFNNSVRYTGPEDKDIIAYNIPTLCLNAIPEKSIKVENVYYDFDKATLQAQSFSSLDDLVQLLNDNPTMEIELSAHTDSKGSDEYNMQLSKERAQSVVDYLITKGINTNRLTAKGYGETMPVASNENADGSDNPEGRQMNRRTEFRVLKN